MPWLLKCGLDRLLFNDFIRGITPLKFLSKSIAEWRVTQGNSLPGRDLFAALLDAKDPQTGRGLDLKDLISEAALFIVGGSDTTITANTATMFYLLHYPNTLERLQHELRTKFKDAEDIRMGTDLASCTYLLACIDESMRLANPIGSLLPRETLPGGLKVDGEWFPPGVDLGVPTYTLHHNAEYFPDPFEFRPERWLPMDKRSRISAESFTAPTASEAAIDTGLEVAQSAFMPFGIGRTSCVGKYLAYQEISLIIARVVWQHDMRIQPGSTIGEGHSGLGWGRKRKNEFQLQDRFVSTHKGPMVEFKARKTIGV